MIFIKKNQRGFIALFSVIIITSVLLLAAVSLSFSGFFGRLNVFDTELKRQSDALAEACINVAILKLAEETSYDPDDECVEVEDDCPSGESVCTIISIEDSGSNKVIRTEGSAGKTLKAYTYYEAEVDPETFEINYFKELEDRP